jgi:hypothetical protein
MEEQHSTPCRNFDRLNFQRNGGQVSFEFKIFVISQTCAELVEVSITGKFPLIMLQKSITSPEVPSSIGVKN